MSIRTEIIEYIREMKQELVYKDDSIFLENVNLRLIEAAFGADFDEYEVNGYDILGRIGVYSINIDIRNGDAEVILLEGEVNPLDEIEEDVYTITSGKYENVPPAVVCTEDEITDDSLHPFYLIWVGYSCNRYTIIFARNEDDARKRAFAIWGNFDDIVTQDGWERKKAFYGISFNEKFAKMEVLQLVYNY